MKFLLSFLLPLLSLIPSLTAAAMPYVFSRLDASDGLSDNQVQHILQLPDGRMVFTTRGNINLYDGMHFHYIHRNDSDVCPLPHYKGAYHVYVGPDDRLWVKDYRRMWCLDLRHECYLQRPADVFREMGLTDTVTDLFVDEEKGLWLVTDKGLFDATRKRYLPYRKETGELQDVTVRDGNIYLYLHTGEVECRRRNDGTILYRTAAYPASERPLYSAMSLVVPGPDGHFYQVRTGRRAILLDFDPQTRTWRRLMETDQPLHTLIVPNSRTAYISSLNGIWAIDLHTGKPTFRSTLPTTEGASLQTDLNTLYQDRQQGIWIGTDNQGLLYAHPERFKFHSAPTPEALSVPFPLPEADFTQGRHPERFQGRRYNDIYTDRHGRTWAGTPDGLRLFLPGQTEARTLYTEDGLPNNFIHGITEDRRGRIWVSTSDGISCLYVSEKADTLRFTNYRHEDGTLKGEYLDHKAHTLTDGRILMGGVGGWTLFHPDSVRIPLKHFAPLPTGLSLHGEPVRITPPGSTDSSPLLPQAPPYVRHYEFNHRQNHIGFDFSALNYAWPTHTYYRYRLVQANDSAWHVLRPQADGGAVDEKGNLHLSFSLLPPGHYRLQVMASTRESHWDGPATEITFVIHAPWWRTRLAYTLYTLLCLCLIALGIYLYIRQTRRRILRQHKEEILLLRIQHLIERCDSYERQNAGTAASAAEVRKEEPPINAADSEFLNRAVALVEAHIDTPGYSVEQLSKDLCMERSGLYKKLSTLVDKSPSLFIRSVRLKRAADLIRKGGMSMAEVADRAGFSSASYMSKCFQEEFGCKPSEYAARTQEST